MINNIIVNNEVLYNLFSICERIETRIKNIKCIYDDEILQNFNNELYIIHTMCMKNIKINNIYNKYGLYQQFSMYMYITLREISTIMERIKLLLLYNNNDEYKNLKLQYIEDTKKFIEYFYMKYIDNR
jgi:hypothetical protein